MVAPAKQLNAASNPDIAALRQRAVESVTLAIELFNRPVCGARTESVLILFHHTFEMLLKSAIVDATGTAFDEQRGYSYGFDTCLSIAEQQLKMIDADERRFLSMLDNLRDSAIHYYQDVPEGVLYIFAQGSVSLFNRLLQGTTGAGLLAHLPNRVLPISSLPPSDVSAVLDQEFEKIQALARRTDISKQQAIASLRPLMAFKIGGESQHRRMTVSELDNAVERLRTADTWRTVFPEIARVEFVTSGDPIPVTVRVVKSDPNAIPVKVVKPGDEAAPQGTIIEREINIMDKFNMGLQQLAEKLEISRPRTLAMIREYGVQQDRESYREITVGAVKVKRYSKKALDKLRDEVGTAEECWEKHGRSLARAKRRSSR